MDSEMRDKLSELVEELTTSGEPTLNTDKMKEVKKICRTSDQYIEHLYHLLMTQLDQEHAEVRLSAFLMVAELFSRSHHFRSLLVANMQEFLDLTVETDTEQPLPPPKEVAQKLKRLAIQTVQTWHATYGEAYKKLALGYHFLKQVKKVFLSFPLDDPTISACILACLSDQSAWMKKRHLQLNLSKTELLVMVDFQDVEARSVTERRRQEEKQRRLHTIYKEKLDKAKAEMEEACVDIEESLTEIHNCLQLLLPDPQNFSLCNLEPPASSEGGGETSSAGAPAGSEGGGKTSSAGAPAGSEGGGETSSAGAPAGSEGGGDTSSAGAPAGSEGGGETSSAGAPAGSEGGGETSSAGAPAGSEGGGDTSSAGAPAGSEGGGETSSAGAPAGSEGGGETSSAGAHGGSRSSEDVQPCCSHGLEEEPERSKQKRHQKDCSDSESEAEERPDENAFLRNSGVMSHKYSLELDISSGVTLQECEDNEAVLNTVRDLHRLITTKHLPAVQAWIQIFTKVGGEEQLLRRALDLKCSLDAALEKHKCLHISQTSRQRRVMRADESDDDFEEVPEKDGFEPHVLDDLRAEYGLEPLASTAGPTVMQKPPRQPATKQAPLSSSSALRAKRKAREEEQDPTSAAATLHVLKQRLPATALDSCAASGSGVTPTGTPDTGEVPVVPFDIDLYYWGKEQPTAGKIIKYSSQHQFWVPNEMEEEVVNEELSAQMKSRRITFAGRFQPVQHKCRAPLPNGALCERQDRYKCPFHGNIIPRDDLGRPTNPEDAERLEKERRKQQEEQPDWRDPELMREIEAATGEDLGSSKAFGKGRKGCKGKKRKRKYPNLTDLKQSADTSRSRLEKKVFNKCSMRRVTEVMNKMDRRKHEKFANQFNYALS